MEDGGTITTVEIEFSHQSSRCETACTRIQGVPGTRRPWEGWFPCVIARREAGERSDSISEARFTRKSNLNGRRVYERPSRI